MTINYERGQQRWPKQKAALTRATKKGYEAVVKATAQVILEWNEDGAWPDDWARWQRALEDTYWEARRNEPYDSVVRHVDMDTIAEYATTAGNAAEAVKRMGLVSSWQA